MANLYIARKVIKYDPDASQEINNRITEKERNNKLYR